MSDYEKKASLLQVLGWYHDDKYRWTSPYRWDSGKYDFVEALEKEKDRFSKLEDFFSDKT